MSYSVEKKLEIFQQYVRNVRLDTDLFIYTDRDIILRKLQFINFHSRPEAIAVIKVLWVFTRLKIWDTHSLKEREILLRIFLEQKRLFVGWHHLTSEGVRILTTGDEYGSLINNSVNNNRVKFNSAFSELPEDPQTNTFEDLNLMANWDLTNTDAYFDRANTFGEVLDNVVNTIRTQNADEKFDPYSLTSNQKLDILHEFNNFTTDLRFRNGNPFLSFSDTNFRGDDNPELLEEELLAQALDSFSAQDEAIGVGVSQAINFEPSTEGSDILSSLVDVTDLGETEKSGSGNECRMLAPSPCLSEESLNFSPLFSLILRLGVYILHY